MQIEVWSLQLLGYLMQSSTMLGAIEAITELTGRQKVPPAWTQEGAVVGLEGGTANVTSIVDRMYAAGVPMAGNLCAPLHLFCCILLRCCQDVPLHITSLPPHTASLPSRLYFLSLGIWLQDWVGLQHSWDGDRLIWNWELNVDHYPGEKKCLLICY